MSGALATIIIDNRFWMGVAVGAVAMAIIYTAVLALYLLRKRRDDARLGE